MNAHASDALIAALESSRAQFLELVADVRPDLHRYCARMTGSLADGEDVVQDTLARAYFQLSELGALPPLRPWLFRIAHNRAIDQLRRNAHRATEPLDDAIDSAGDAAAQPEEALARRQAVQAAVSTFAGLPSTQRACVILKDVLDESLDDIGVLLDMKLPAVKSALHRGRAALRERAGATAPRDATAPSANLAQYARLFNARDWDGIRALLAADARLDLVSRRKLQGRDAVGVYFSNYDRTAGWRVAPGRIDGAEALLVWTGSAEQPAYFVQLEWHGMALRAIRDFRYVPYVLQDWNAAR